MGAVSEAVSHLFVYGTLMPGQPRWPALRPFATAWEPVTASGRLWDTGRGYPAVLFSEDGTAVRGFRVAVSPDLLPDALAVLDGIEAEGVLYRRVEVQTSAGPAMSYEWLGPTEGLVRLSGGWR